MKRSIPNWYYVLSASIQAEQGEPALLERGGVGKSWLLLHLQSWNCPTNVESSNGANDKATGEIKYLFSKPLLWVWRNICLNRALWDNIFVDKSNYDGRLPLRKAEIQCFVPCSKMNFNAPKIFCFKIVTRNTGKKKRIWKSNIQQQKKSA